MSAPPKSVALSLTVKDAAAALEFYAKAFGAVENYRMPGPDGDVGHAEFRIGETSIFISGEWPDWQAAANPEGHTASCLFCIQVPDCDTAHAQAIAAGAELVSLPQDYPWGMRSSVVRDPYGYRWSLGQITEELTPEQIMERLQSDSDA